MNDPAGRLQIHLHRQTGGLGVRIQSSRLTSASRVFIGKTLAETVRTLPSLFSVCATAQTVACVTAGEAALGIRPPPRALATRLLLVDLETVREHLWRLLLDWPRFLGEGPQGPAMAQVMAASDQGRRALVANADPLRPGAGLGAVAFRADGATTADPTDAKADATAATADAAAPTDGTADAAAALTALSAIASRQVLGQAPDEWLATIGNLQALRHWARTGDTAAARLIDLVNRQGWAGLGRSPVAVLPPLTLAALEARLSGPGAEAFITAPRWHGAAAESTPFSRQLHQPLVANLAGELGNGLLPRLAGQLVELSSLLVELPRRLAALTEANPPAEFVPAHAEPLAGRHAAAAPAPGTGLAQVQAARGLLVHRLTLERGRLADYRILAPTEWNFHPQGAAALGLATLPATDEATLRRLAGLFITALDPCVAYNISIS